MCEVDSQLAQAVRAKVRFIGLAAVVLAVGVACTPPEGTAPPEEAPTATTPIVTTTSQAPDPEYPDPRAFAQMAYLPVSNRVLMFGGVSGGLVADGWIFDAVSEQWMALNSPESPPPRLGHAMAYLDSLGVVALFGGGDLDHLIWCLQFPCPAGILDDMWYFDPASSDWSLLPLFAGGPGPRSGSAMAYDQESDRLVLFGGIGPWDGGLDRSGTLLGDTWVFDPSVGEWSKVDTAGTAPDPRAFHQVVYDPMSDRVLMWGGWVGSSTARDATMWSFDVETSEWSILDVPESEAPTPRWMHAMVYEPASGLLVILGGEWFEEGVSTGGGDTWLFDPMQRQWQRGDDLVHEWTGASAAPLGNGTVLTFIADSSGVYDTATDEWRWWNPEG